jgi:hypothetical protein
MSLRVIEELKDKADELFKGLAEKILNEKELLPAPGYNQKVNIPGQDPRRIILEFLYGADSDNTPRRFSPHFANAQRRVIWIGKNRTTRGAGSKNSAPGRIYSISAEKSLHHTKKESFELLSIKQAEEKIICLINNYLTAL